MCRLYSQSCLAFYGLSVHYCLLLLVFFFFFFFKQKTAYEIVSRDWSSDVCSSDLKKRGAAATRNEQYKKRGAAATRNGQYKKGGRCRNENRGSIKSGVLPQDRKSVV